MRIETKTRSLAEIKNLLGCELAAEVLRASGKLRLRVTGASMLPAIWPGDVISVRSFDRDFPRPGDVVLCYRRGKLIAHRLVRRFAHQGESQWSLRGDSVSGNDEPVPTKDLLGKVIAIERGSRRMRLQRSFPGCIVSWILRRSAFATRVMLLFLNPI